MNYCKIKNPNSTSVYKFQFANVILTKANNFFRVKINEICTEELPCMRSASATVKVNSVLLLVKSFLNLAKLELSNNGKV